MADLSGLVALSRLYGSDPEWVLAGGGNTSFKDSSTLWVKASGTALGSIGAEGFCAMDRGRLDAIWKRTYPEDAGAREEAALADLMAARLAGESKRPSVETLMHGFFPQAYVVHTHPALVNGLTCGRGGEDAFRRLFAGEGVWVPFVDPGYILARTVRAAVEDFRARHGRVPAIMLMQNHGLLVAAENPEGVEELSARVVSLVSSETGRAPDLRPASTDPAAVGSLASRLAALAGAGTTLRFRADTEILARAASDVAFRPLSAAFSPDHIVYAGHEFLRCGKAGLEAAWADYTERNSCAPRIVLVAGIGAFSLGASAAAAETALLLFVDACKVAAWAESFGGALHMSPEKIAFIRNWEVEKYRSSLGSAAREET